MSVAACLCSCLCRSRKMPLVVFYFSIFLFKFIEEIHRWKIQSDNYKAIFFSLSAMNDKFFALSLYLSERSPLIYYLLYYGTHRSRGQRYYYVHSYMVHGDLYRGSAVCHCRYGHVLYRDHINTGLAQHILYHQKSHIINQTLYFFGCDIFFVFVMLDI